MESELVAGIRKIGLFSLTKFSGVPAYKPVYGGPVNVAGKIKAYSKVVFRFMLAYSNALGRYSSSNLINDAVSMPPEKSI